MWKTRLNCCVRIMQELLCSDKEHVDQGHESLRWSSDVEVCMWMRRSRSQPSESFHMMNAESDGAFVDKCGSLSLSQHRVELWTSVLCVSRSGLDSMTADVTRDVTAQLYEGHLEVKSFQTSRKAPGCSHHARPHGASDSPDSLFSPRLVIGCSTDTQTTNIQLT